MGYKIFIVIIGASLYVFSASVEHHLSLDDKAALSASRGAEWLLEHPKEFEDPGILWVLDDINKQYCSSNELVNEKIDIRLENVKNHPIEYAYIRLIDEKARHQLTEEILSKRKTYFDDILVPALYCDLKDISSSTEDTIKTYSNQSKYQLTHAFMALLWMKERGCLDELLSNLLDQTAIAVASEQNSIISFGDLYAERTAFLLYGKYDDLVPKNWIENIINAQEYSGGWSTKQDSRFFGAEENPHTSVLSLWSLVLYTEQCPFE